MPTTTTPDRAATMSRREKIEAGVDAILDTKGAWLRVSIARRIATAVVDGIDAGKVRGDVLREANYDGTVGWAAIAAYEAVQS